jgi:hypothetical protein
MTQFSDIISSMVMKTLLMMGRGTVADYNGPNYIYQSMSRNCGTDANDPPTGDPLEKGKAECEASPIAGDNPTGAIYTNANEVFRTLDDDMSVLVAPEMQTVQLTLPSGKTVDVLYPHARADNIGQKMWIKALDFCIDRMGPRPTPPFGKKMQAAEYMADYAQYQVCLASQSVFMQQCADRIAFITRPDCENPAFSTFCERSKQVCQFAQSFGFVLPQRFENCEKGLSLSETQEAVHNICDGMEHVAQSVREGATSAGLAAALASCQRARGQWKTILKKQKTNFSISQQIAEKVKSCWPR